MYLIRISEETGKEAIFQETDNKNFPNFWKGHNFSIEKKIKVRHKINKINKKY